MRDNPPKITDADYAEQVRTNLGKLSLPASATEWLMALWRSTQLLDDIADGDPVSREALDQSVFDLLVGMSANPFFSANSTALLSCVALQIHKWQASDALEREGNASERTYMWRAGFWDVVLLVTHLCHGREPAQELGPVILEMYGENCWDYLEEFNG